MRYDGGNPLKYQENREGIRALPRNAMECALACAIPTMRTSMAARGKAVSNAGISGRRAITKPMRRILSIGRDIEGEVSEVQIPVTKIEL